MPTAVVLLLVWATLALTSCDQPATKAPVGTTTAKRAPTTTTTSTPPPTRPQADCAKASWSCLLECKPDDTACTAACLGDTCQRCLDALRGCNDDSQCRRRCTQCLGPESLAAPMPSCAHAPSLDALMQRIERPGREREVAHPLASPTGTLKRLDALGPRVLDLGKTYSRVLAVSPDGNHLVVGDRYGGIALHASEDGRRLQQVALPQEKSIHRGMSAGFSRQGNLLVIASIVPAQLLIYALPSGILLTKRSVKPTTAYQVRDGQRVLGARHLPFAISSNGNQVAFLDNFDIQVFDVGKRTIVRTLRGHSDPVQAIDFSPSGRYLASSDLRSFRIWNMRQGKDARGKDIPDERRVFAQPNVRALFWYNDEEIVAVFPQMFQLWEINGPKRPSFKWDLQDRGDELVDAARPTRADPAGLMVTLTREGTLFFFDLARRAQLRRLPMPALVDSDLVMGPRGESLWYFVSRETPVQAIDASRSMAIEVKLNREARFSELLTPVREIRGRRDRFLSLHQGGEVRVWQPTQARQGRMPPLPGQPPTHLAVDAKASRAAIYCLNGCLGRDRKTEVLVLDLDKILIEAQLKLPFSPTSSGRHHLLYGPKRELHAVDRFGDLWTMPSFDGKAKGERVVTLDAGRVGANVIAPSGEHLLRAEWPATPRPQGDTPQVVVAPTPAQLRATPAVLMLRDLKRGKATALLDPLDPAMACLFSSNGKHVACLSATRLLTTPTTSPRPRLRSHEGLVEPWSRPLALSPSGRYLLVARGAALSDKGPMGDGSGLIVLDVNRDAVVGRVSTGPSHVATATFLDATTFAVGHYNGRIERWSLQ